MEEIAFSDWPGQPVDLNSGNNPWLPAYGFQTPSALLERDDFIGNPDAEYFLSNSTSHYMYLETIQEETSDDLRSESDLESNSPVGWLATDSETGSVICIDGTDDVDCDSDRELACPAKRRKQESVNLLCVPSDDEQSLSRSSSLLQFETLEKQCQETCSSSPSIYSQFSFDSLEVHRKGNVSPDSLDNGKNGWDDDNESYMSLSIEIPRKDKNASRDSLLYNVTRYSGSEGSDTSEGTLETSRSFDNLRTWRSFDSLPLVNNGSSNKSVKEKISVENLSEDSGYSDHLVKSNSPTELKKEIDDCVMKASECFVDSVKKKGFQGFGAYDGEVFHHINGNFGVSYQDLSIFEKYEPTEDYRSPLINRFMKNKLQRQSMTTTTTATLKPVNIDDDADSKFTSASASEPNLPQAVGLTSVHRTVSSSHNQLDCVSVPKNLNLIGDFGCASDNANSVAAKNWDLTDLREDFERDESIEDDNMPKVKREGSYDMAMTNRVDLSDDEHSYCYKKKLPSTPIVEFDRKVLKAISETSIQSILGSNANIQETYLNDVYSSTPARHTVAKSTPNLALTEQEILHRYLQDERRRSTQDIPRKNSIIKSSTSTSGLSDADEKTMTSLRSFGSTNSRGVHFSPVVSEVNWQDDSVSTATPERESSYSLESTPEREIAKQPQRQANFAATPIQQRLSISQPELSDNESSKREFVDTLKSLRQDFSKSQPDINRLKRRGSQLVKKDEHGALVQAYIDRDGIQYKHTHLDLGKYDSPPHHQSSGGGHVEGRPQPPNHDRRSQQPAVAAMEVQDAHRKDKSPRNKIGGFFSRLASFRFSNRKGQEEKAKLKKRQGAANVAVAQMPQQRLATKEDYIYIPLKGPATTTTTTTASTQPDNRQRNNNNMVNSVSQKPPLPKQPPRVVHASVKRDQTAQDTPVGRDDVEKPRRRRRTTIDSGTPIPRMEEPMGLIETDLDTEVTVITSGNHVKTRSLLNLGADPRAVARHLTAAGEGKARPHKSMEFLLDKQNLKVVEPPENELQKGERVMSEHQLRVQRSLQKLTVPDWYKQSQVPREGFLLKKQPTRDTRWSGTGSKTTSLSSLGSNCQSPVILSPTPTNQPFVRWSTSKLNSTASSPCASTRSSFNARQANGSISPSSVRSSFSYRQPYMGWRSQERLTRPRTPAERLANTILSQSNQPEAHQQESPEIQTSIKEVTSAIVHYVSGLRPEDQRNSDHLDSGSQRSSSVSPRGSQKLCWLESSFVGTKPLDSPQTPVTLSESQSATPVPPSSLRLDLQSQNGESIRA